MDQSDQTLSSLGDSITSPTSDRLDDIQFGDKIIQHKSNTKNYKN